MYYINHYSSPLGQITLASQHNKLVGVWIEGQKYFGQMLSAQKEEAPKLAIFNQTKKWLDDYFAGKKPAITKLALAPQGSEFRHKVWDILVQIPYGKVITYGDIAKQISTNMSSQAVGGAVGHNPLSIIIPCHRVVGTNGNLTGYAGGIDKKVWLLEHEQVDIKDFFVPKKGTAI